MTQLASIKGLGSTIYLVLKYFIEKGAEVSLIYEDTATTSERYFVVTYKNAIIPLRDRNLNFSSVLNSFLAQTITDNKLKTHAVLTAWKIPTPATVAYASREQAEGFLGQYVECVVKPRNGSHGNGITVGVKDVERLQEAVAIAKTVFPAVLLQQYAAGNDFRLLFIDYTFVAAVRRDPPRIYGDGVRSVRQIIESRNAEIYSIKDDIQQGKVDESTIHQSLSEIPLEEVTNARGETFLEYVPAAHEAIDLFDKANVSLGGQTTDVTDMVNKEFTDKISELLRAIGLSVCGLDVLSEDITSAPSERKSYVIELNSAPGIRMHEFPDEGVQRQVSKTVVEALIRHYTAV